MRESHKFREYAQDCVRMAEKMEGKDRQMLLQIAQACEMRAREVEMKEKN